MTQSGGSTKTPAVGNILAGFSQSEVFPMIAVTIERLSNLSQDYVTHEAIVVGLTLDESLRPVLKQIVRHDPQQKTQNWWASNMLQWFSKVQTEGRSEYDCKFERKKINGKWAYRSAKKRAEKRPSPDFEKIEEHLRHGEIGAMEPILAGTAFWGRAEAESANAISDEKDPRRQKEMIRRVELLVAQVKDLSLKDREQILREEIAMWKKKPER